MKIKKDCVAYQVDHNPWQGGTILTGRYEIGASFHSPDDEDWPHGIADSDAERIIVERLGAEVAGHSGILVDRVDKIISILLRAPESWGERDRVIIDLSTVNDELVKMAVGEL